MSDLRINIRVFTWHFKVTDDWKFIITQNLYHKGSPDGWFAIYDFNPFKRID